MKGDGRKGDRRRKTKERGQENGEVEKERQDKGDRRRGIGEEGRKKGRQEK